MDKEIKDFLIEYSNEIICSFIIGSYVYADKFSDIDIIVISKNYFFQKIKTLGEIKLKFNFLPEKMLNEDLSNDKYGSFVYSRFLNPLKVIKNNNIVYKYQKKAIEKELQYNQELIKNENRYDVVKNFILNRGLYFNKYLKNLNIISLSENESIRLFL